VHGFCPVFVLLVTTRRRSASSPVAKALDRFSTNEDADQAANYVIASAGEPIHPLDCFVAPLLAMTGVPEKKTACFRPA
jgi:hypothetical protein